MRLILASASPRRRELLAQLRLDFEVVPADVDETRFPDEAPAAYVERVAKAKAEEVAGPGMIVVAADTTVVHDGKIMGKPGHPEEARAMLRHLQGDVHEVFTGLAVASWDDRPRTRVEVDMAEVHFMAMTDGEIFRYVESGEPLDKAGGYALQGLGGAFVSKVNGSPFTVIGMPIHLLARLVAAAGGDLDSFRAGRVG